MDPDDYDDEAKHIQERHRDLDRIHEAIWFGVKVLIGAVVPLMLTGVGVLVGGYYKQSELVKSQEQTSIQVEKLAEEIHDVSLKVHTMWYAGGWESRDGDHQKRSPANDP